MTVVQSLGSLANLTPGWEPSSWGWRRSPSGVMLSYPVLYRTQPNIRICVDFLARNVAQLGLHFYRRVSDTDRVRLRGHQLQMLLDPQQPGEGPNYATTRYRFVESTMNDMGVWGKAFWFKVRNRQAGMQLLRLPPSYVTVAGGLVPTKFTVQLVDRRVEFPPEDVVYFRYPNPESTIDGLSPIESLRDVLMEDSGLTSYRTHFWGHAARPGAVIERPAEAPEWSDPVRQQFMAEFDMIYSGAENSGKTIVLEDGMKFMPFSQTAEQSQAMEFRKLSREDVARAYHIPLPMVGILDHATFSNIREQHKNLYQDALGPILEMIQEEIELQLIPDFDDVRDVYCEFNIADKLAGSFEEQATALQSAVGRPWLSPDEARARQNLPSKGGDAEELAIPVNLRVGEQPAPEAGEPTEQPPSLGDQVNAAGILIRSGFEPQPSLEAVGLPTIEHTGLLPVTVQSRDKAEAPAAIPPGGDE